MTYEIDRARIIFEQFEDETVLVNTESGYYYSLSASGSEILHLLEEGCSGDNLALALFGRSETCDSFRPVIESFVEQLKAESILTARAKDRPVRIGTEPGPARYAPGAGYEPPVLERFDDVRSLLLIDPVHQVDQKYGWPKEMSDAHPSGAGN
jgi:hypothetical protein